MSKVLERHLFEIRVLAESQMSVTELCQRIEDEAGPSMKVSGRAIQRDMRLLKRLVPLIFVE